MSWVLWTLLWCGEGSPGNNPADLLASKERFFQPRIGNIVSGDLSFVDDTGKPVTLNKYGNDRPIILVLAYYRCPQICGKTLSDLNKALRGIGTYDVGRNLDVVVVSFDPKEVPAQAADYKKQYVELYVGESKQPRPDAEKGFHFLTGQQEQIDQLMEETGFYAVWNPQKKDYAHVRAIMILSPQRKITHYFTEGDYSPLYMSQALNEALTGKSGSFIQNFLLMCYIYDPVQGKNSMLVLTIVKIGGILTIATLAGIWLGMWWRATRTTTPAQVQGDIHGGI
ncbi:MAG: SCO family protein [Gemmataceae bacterium]